MDRVSDGYLRQRGGLPQPLEDCLADASQREAWRARATRTIISDLREEFQGRRAQAALALRPPRVLPARSVLTLDAAPPTSAAFLAGPGNRKAGERRRQVLAGLVELLANRKSDRVTTASLAQHLGLCEAALYRVFGSKSGMLEALIVDIEHALFEQIEQLDRHMAVSGASLQEHAGRLVAIPLHFAEAHPGASRVMAGDALAMEDEALRQRMTLVFTRFEKTLADLLQRDRLMALEASRALASALGSFCVGRLLRFANSGFVQMPSAQLAACLGTMLR
ncbi:nucleoid occlusion factor SlmA [Xylophilus rhododendri]|uniref:Nucleoid occlusion factor SlmA n=1 Tax=Xylophilus rhododendri TaxID=2697032 RepID=A0A857IZ82_9BURK|nr:nucleoid occlusion factor SlmA [Xylophilus rhododendri]QHI96607.1 nucleoid occlusion factor SlmA [Xylophilus rhododendri]